MLPLIIRYTEISSQMELNRLVLCLCIITVFYKPAIYFSSSHDVDETGQWLQEDLKRLHDTFEITPLKGDKKDADRLVRELDVSIVSWNKLFPVPAMQ